MKKLTELENQRIALLNARIDQLKTKGWDNLSDLEKLELLKLQQEVLNIELDQIKRKNPPLSEEDLKRLQEIEDEMQRLKMQELLLKEKMGTLNEEEKKFLE